MLLIGLAVMKAIVATLLVVSNAGAFKEPDGFRGMPWGASEDALRDKLGETSEHGILFDRCGAYPTEQRWLGDRFCAGAFPIGGITVRAVYDFRANRFVRVTLAFRSQDFNDLVVIFRERYGPPTTSTREPFKTQGGLEAINQFHRWTGPTITIGIQLYSGQISEGAATLTTHGELQESARLRAEQLKVAGEGPVTHVVLDRRGQLLRAALGFAGCSMPSYDRPGELPSRTSSLGR
jgi:hypothetical protein